MSRWPAELIADLVSAWIRSDHPRDRAADATISVDRVISPAFREVGLTRLFTDAAWSKSYRGCYTVVVVTHNLEQTRRIADYAAFFRAIVGTGSPIDDGTGEQIFETPQPT